MQQLGSFTFVVSEKEKKLQEFVKWSKNHLKAERKNSSYSAHPPVRENSFANGCEMKGNIEHFKHNAGALVTKRLFDTAHKVTVLCYF
jgi:hypothetical protein